MTICQPNSNFANHSHTTSWDENWATVTEAYKGMLRSEYKDYNIYNCQLLSGQHLLAAPLSLSYCITSCILHTCYTSTSNTSLYMCECNVNHHHCSMHIQSYSYEWPTLTRAVIIFTSFDTSTHSICTYNMSNNCYSPPKGGLKPPRHSTLHLWASRLRW